MSSKIYQGECPPIIFAGLLALGVMLTMASLAGCSEIRDPNVPASTKFVAVTDGCEIRQINNQYPYIYIAKCKSTDSVTTSTLHGKVSSATIIIEENEEVVKAKAKAKALSKLTNEEKAALNLQ